jgi:hypothetical protein
LIERHHAACQEDLPQRASLAACLHQEGVERVFVDQLQIRQQGAELAIAGVDGLGERQDVSTRRNERLVLRGKGSWAVIFLSQRHRHDVGRLPIQGKIGFVDAGQVAQLAAIPFAHVDKVAIHLLALTGHQMLLLLERLGFLGQLFRSGADFLGLLFDEGLAALQARFVA